ncbi:hypothetical protein AGMMS49965_10680 [Bacteroidia bacterium]|nr:hypothetical protein AGMMS49965_10680 [Bacteroidia bacterium]
MMFNEQIKQLREERQISQRKLAVALGVDTTSYCKIEKGKRRVRKEHITIVVDLLQTNCEELLKLWLANGKIVRWGNFGAFQVNVSSEGAETEAKFNAAQIKGSKAVFRPGIVFKEMQNNLKYERYNRKKAHTFY